MPDFEFDVGINREDLSGDLEALDEGFRQVSDIAEVMASRFLEADRAATELGISIRAFAGITRQTEDTYRNFVAAFSRESGNLRSATLTVFAPTMDFIAESLVAVQNVISAEQEEEDRSLPTFEGGFLNRPGGFLVGKRVRRLSSREAELKAARAKAKGIQKRNLLLGELAEVRERQSELKERAFEEAEQRRIEFLRTSQRDERRQRIQVALDDVDQREFLGRQQISRELFEQSQIIAPGQATIANRIQRQIRARQFELRQESQMQQRALSISAEGQRRDILQANRADEAMIDLQIDVRKIAERFEIAADALEEEAKAIKVKILDAVEGN